MSIWDRIAGRTPAPAARKAAYGGAWLSALQSGPLLSSAGADYQSRARRYLQLYSVGWFHKAGSRVARDVASLEVTLSYEDAEGDNAERVVTPPRDAQWGSLSPEEQLLRLMEKPNPYQTGRVLRHKTQVRLDFAGRAFWWLEGGDGGALPTAVYGISPSRLWPAKDPAGRVVGWVLDRDRQGGGTPFTADEIIAFSYPTAEDDLDADGGQGVVEPVYAQAPISDLLAKHEADVLSTGGRLAGMAWPKSRTLDADEFNDAMRAWRNVASDPNAARRLLLFPEPMEYAAGAATPAELGIPDLATLSRDEICSAWPISPEMLGVPAPAGLNSGDTRRWTRKEYWEGTVHPRAEVIEDALQQWLVPRYEAACGRPLDLDLEEPDLDDAAALIEKADALDKLIAAGFDGKEAVAAVGLDHISWAPPAPKAPPEPPIPDANPLQRQPVPADAATMPMPMAGGTPMGKARKAAAGRRAQVLGEELPGLRGVLASFLDDQRARLRDDIAREWVPKKAVPAWWDGDREDRLLAEAMTGLYVRLSRTALQVVADATGRMVAKDSVARVARRVLEQASARITGVNDTTRDAVTGMLEEAQRRGYSAMQVAEGVPAEGFPGLARLPAFDTARAELVARTETMLAYNASALAGYGEMGVREVEAIDGDQDPECAERDGRVFTVEEAAAVEDHPNGTLDWIPLTGSMDKAWRGSRVVFERDADGRISGVAEVPA